jgi:hypothetical protein
MNADELIESYVADVAAQLPGKQRDAVALDLRARLKEQLEARAIAAFALGNKLVRSMGAGPAKI